MKFQKWTTETPSLAVALKLCEEAGEVGKVINDNFTDGRIIPEAWSDKDRKMLAEELTHVEFLCSVLRQKFSLGA